MRVRIPVGCSTRRSRCQRILVTYNNGDRHVLAQKIDVDPPRISDSTVFVDVNFLLRDCSGSIDDPFSGFVDVTVVADRA